MEMSNIKQNVIISSIIVLVITVVCAMSYVIYTQRNMLKAMEQNTEQQRLLQDNITAIKSSLVSNETFEAKLKTLNMDIDVIKSDLKKTGGKLDSIIVVSNTTPGYIGTGLPSNGYYPMPNVDPNNPNSPPQTCPIDSNGCIKDQYGYHSKVPYLKLNEPLQNKSNVPFGEVAFNANQENPWTLKIHPRKYETNIVLATDATGRKTAYAKMSITPEGGNRVDLPETQVQFVEKMPTASFSLWNPRLMFGLDFGYSTKPGFAYGPVMQLYTSSYGQLRDSPDWHFVGLGVSYDINNKAYNIAISPFAYRIFNNFVFKNTYIAPNINISSNGDVAVMAGIRAGL